MRKQDYEKRPITEDQRPLLAEYQLDGIHEALPFQGWVGIIVTYRLDPCSPVPPGTTAAMGH